MDMQSNFKDLIYKDLSYKIIGVLFDVYNHLGEGHREKMYQKALVVAFRKCGLFFEQQLCVNLEYGGENIGRYYFDFFINRKIVLEIKIKRRFSKIDYEQIKKYLKAKDIKLGILATFCSDGVKFCRIVNIY